MDGLIECLKECNVRLESLRTSDCRFVAWIIYSTRLGCFIAGVDAYSNDDQNLQHVVAKGIDASPIGAMNQVYRKICEWERDGGVPLCADDVVSPKHTDSESLPKSICDAAPEMYELLQDISCPRRGTEAEMWKIEPRVVQLAARIIADVVQD